MQRLLLAAFLLTMLYAPAQTPRNLLQQKTAPGHLARILDTYKDWIRYPAYKDRSGWDNFTSPVKSQLIKEGESYAIITGD